MSTPTTTATAAPPVDLEQVRRYLASESAPGRYMLGAAKDGTPVWWHPATDGPLEYVAGAGAGGTVALRSLALQALWAGAARVDVIDPKGVGWRDMDLDTPDVAERGLTVHAPAVAGMAAVAALVADAVDDIQARRQDPTASWDGAERVILVDGLENLVFAARKHDRMMAVDLVEDLAEAARDGDAVGVHLVVRSARGSQEVLPGPGPDHRVVALSRTTRRVLKRALPEATPTPPVAVPSGAGRWLICQGPTHTLVWAPAALVGTDPLL